MPRGEVDDTGCISPPLPSVELRLVDDEYKDVDPGQPGELLVRGPTVMRGYFNDPEATKNAFHDGWLCTGDVAVMRDGKFYIIDRKKVSNSPHAHLTSTSLCFGQLQLTRGRA
jgi:long-subunit acyl-CoA synthetase (AMP-forming)